MRSSAAQPPPGRAISDRSAPGHPAIPLTERRPASTGSRPTVRHSSQERAQRFGQVGLVDVTQHDQARHQNHAHVCVPHGVRDSAAVGSPCSSGSLTSSCSMLTPPKIARGNRISSTPACLRADLFICVPPRFLPVPGASDRPRDRKPGTSSNSPGCSVWDSHRISRRRPSPSKTAASGPLDTSLTASCSAAWYAARPGSRGRSERTVVSARRLEQRRRSRNLTGHVFPGHWPWTR